MTWAEERAAEAAQRERARQLDDARTSTAIRLEDLCSRYTNRRSIAGQFVNEVTQLVAQRFDELELAYTTSVEVASEATRRAHRDEVLRLEKSRDEWRELCQSANARLDERRTIRQELEQSAGADDAKVTITNGYVGWTVAGLEEIAYRLRTGGAVDDTPVDVDKARAIAMVPAPNLVQLDASPKAVPHLAPPAPNVVEDGLRVDWRVVVGLVVVVLSIVAGAVIL